MNTALKCVKKEHFDKVSILVWCRTIAFSTSTLVVRNSSILLKAECLCTA